MPQDIFLVFSTTFVIWGSGMVWLLFFNKQDYKILEGQGLKSLLSLVKWPLVSTGFAELSIYFLGVSYEEGIHWERGRTQEEQGP